MPWSYARQKRYWRQFHPYPFLMNDGFAESHAAVLPSPKLCNPGPGSWLVTDLDSRMSEAGNLTFAAGSSAWDRCILVATTPFARKAGQYLEFELTPTNTAYFRAGWNFNAGTSAGTGANGQILYNEATLYPGGGGFINVTDGLDVVSPLYPYSAGVSYTGRVYDTGTGFLYYVRATADGSTGWKLLWERTHSFPRVPHFNPHLNNHSISGTMSHYFVRQGKVKPPVAVVMQPGNGQTLSGPTEGIFDVEVRAPVNSQRRLFFRGSDTQNYWRVTMDTAAQTFYLDKVVAGVVTTIALTSVLWSPGQSYRVSVCCFANHIRTFFGIQSGPSTDDAFNETAGLFGVGNPVAPDPFTDGDFINLRAQTGGSMLLN